MKTQHPKRFTDAVTKLYNAFHENRLQGLNCKACAVGNICDNNYRWTSSLGFGRIYTESTENILNTGYSAKELAEVELKFLYGSECTSEKYIIKDNSWEQRGINSKMVDFRDSKETQFKGLCAVVEYLCELDNISNIMDVQSLFETDNDKPKRQLQEVFVPQTMSKELLKSLTQPTI